jgi:hypothetical protein
MLRFNHFSFYFKVLSSKFIQIPTATRGYQLVLGDLTTRIDFLADLFFLPFNSFFVASAVRAGRRGKPDVAWSKKQKLP